MHSPDVSDESYLDSWQLSLPDKADSTRRLYREVLVHDWCGQFTRGVDFDRDAAREAAAEAVARERTEPPRKPAPR